jgi:hypothetical protein
MAKLVAEIVPEFFHEITPSKKRFKKPLTEKGEVDILDKCRRETTTPGN